jgi:hypothetical protein
MSMKESGVAVAERQVVMGNLEHDSEATIPGFALQQHLPALTAFFSHQSTSLRYTTLMLIGTLLRQGMVCPLDVLAPLIALQGDHDAKIRQESLHMLQTENEKHPTFLANRMIDGTEQCYLFQVKAIGTVSAVEEYEDGVASLFGPFYSTCIRSNKKREYLEGMLSRSSSSLVKLREQMAQHPDSYDAILHSQMQEIRLAKEKVELEASSVERTAQDSSVTGAMSNTANLASEQPKLAIARKMSALSRSNSFGNRSAKQIDNQMIAQNIQDAFDKAGSSDFLCATLASLPFEAIEDPLQLIYLINRNVSVGTSLTLLRLKQQILSMGGELRKVGEMQPPMLGTKPKSIGGGSTAGAGLTSGRHRSAALPFGSVEGEADLLISDAASAAWISRTLEEKGDGASVGPDLIVFRICELILLSLEIRNNEAILRLKSYLKLVFGISDDRCMSFNPEDRSAIASSSQNAISKLNKSNSSLVYQPHPPTVSPLQELLGASTLAEFTTNPTKFCKRIMSENGSNNPITALMRKICMDYNRVTHLLNSDPEDFTLTVRVAAESSGSVKRKRKPVNGSESKRVKSPSKLSAASVAPVKKETPKRKKKKSSFAMFYDGSSDEEEVGKGNSELEGNDDDDDDDEWVDDA